MATPATPAASLVPSLVPMLPDAANKRLHHPATDLRGGDQLHLTAPALGFPRGSVHPVYGYCSLLDEQGRVYCVRAYVRPWDAAGAVAYAEREAVRFPMQHPQQQREQWFGARLLYLVEIDLTDYADCLRLERAPAAVAARLGYKTDGATLQQAA